MARKEWAGVGFVTVRFYVYMLGRFPPSVCQSTPCMLQLQVFDILFN